MTRKLQHQLNTQMLCLFGLRGGLWLARSTSGREVAGSSWLAAGYRVATVGQLLFAPWAWAYSTPHPLGVGK